MSFEVMSSLTSFVLKGVAMTGLSLLSLTFGNWYCVAGGNSDWINSPSLICQLVITLVVGSPMMSCFQG